MNRSSLGMKQVGWFSSRAVGSGHEKKMDHKTNPTMTQKILRGFKFFLLVEFLH